MGILRNKNRSTLIHHHITTEEADQAEPWALAVGDHDCFIDIDAVLEAGDGPHWLIDLCQEAYDMDVKDLQLVY